MTSSTSNNRKEWLLGLAAMFAVAGGATFFFQLLQGKTGSDLLEFATLYIIAPLALSLILLFMYLRKPA